MKLTALPTTTLAQDEQVIENALGTFFEVGQALMRIRDERKYEQAGFSGFVAYLESKPWGFGIRHADHLMSAVTIRTIVPIDNEGQARALAPVLRLHKESPPEAQAQAVNEVYEAAVVEAGDKPVTAKIIEAEREKRGTTKVIEARMAVRVGSPAEAKHLASNLLAIWEEIRLVQYSHLTADNTTPLTVDDAQIVLAEIWGAVDSIASHLETLPTLPRGKK